MKFYITKGGVYNKTFWLWSQKPYPRLSTYESRNQNIPKEWITWEPTAEHPDSRVCMCLDGLLALFPNVMKAEPGMFEIDVTEIKDGEYIIRRVKNEKETETQS